jgi:hypothetical protein
VDYIHTKSGATGLSLPLAVSAASGSYPLSPIRTAETVVIGIIGDSVTEVGWRMEHIMLPIDKKIRGSVTSASLTP